jgi:hypothetical protein
MIWYAHTYTYINYRHLQRLPSLLKIARINCRKAFLVKMRGILLRLPWRCVWPCKHSVRCVCGQKNHRPHRSQEHHRPQEHHSLLGYLRRSAYLRLSATQPDLWLNQRNWCISVYLIVLASLHPPRPHAARSRMHAGASVHATQPGCRPMAKPPARLMCLSVSHSACEPAPFKAVLKALLQALEL